MTTPYYPSGCAEKSEVRGLAPASDPERNAWFVNLNHGNANVNHQNNDGLALAVRGPVASPGEYHGAATFRDLYQAWRRARKQKCSQNQAQFESQAFSRLLSLECRLTAGTWGPAPSLCFTAKSPKAREIHAPDFEDRVVHHWLVPQLEAIYEPVFIHDSYANREGKGTHAAVRRLQQFVHQVDSGQGDGHYLQLDIHNFFNSINRRLQYEMVKQRLQKVGAPLILQKTVHALLRHSPTKQGVIYRATPEDRALVPPHKRLENAAPGCGVPIGNLTSQFFGNVYLNELDQFIKHVLKVKRYLRYVDDFILIHESRAQLEAWRIQIEQFLQERLQLRLKAGAKLRRLRDGIDFLGYVVWPTHTTVRRRVVSHVKEKLHDWQQRHVRGGCIVGTPADFRQIQAVWSSYGGHFEHANSFKLRQRFAARYPWLATALAHTHFDYRMEDQNLVVELKAAA